MLGWLSQFIDWLNRQPAGTQALVILALGLGWPLASWLGKATAGVIRSRRERARVAQAVKAASDAAKQREFDNYPAELGTVDHGDNMVVDMDAMLKLLRDALAPAGRIYQHLYVELPRRFPRQGDTDSVRKKRNLFRQAAVVLREDVVLLERISKDAKESLGRFTAGCRVVLALPIASANDATVLSDLKKQYQGGGESFRQLAELLRSNCDKMDLLRGKQQDLTRVVERTNRALRGLGGVARDLSRFLLSEAVPTIDNSLKQ